MAIVREYRSRLPLYLLAHCPVCAKPVSEPIDTFSLNGFGWREPNRGLGWSHSMGTRSEEYNYCQHIKIISFFLNLNGIQPDDLLPDKVLRSGPEVPSIMTVPMQAEGMQIVMHKLPIGRFDDTEPQPHYAVYFLSYFASDEDAFNNVIRKWDCHYGMVDYDEVDYDLRHWTEEGKLLWLDASKPDLPLLDASSAEFPYPGISGSKWPERQITRDPEKPKRSLFGRLFGSR